MKKLLENLIGVVGEKVAAEIIKKYLTVENMKNWADDALDVIENLIDKSETKLDDKMVLPVLKAIRTGFDIPDGND